MDQQAKRVGGKFACPTCGKQYSWKPQLAGKKAKCACGAAIVVPNAEAPSPPPPPSSAASSNPLDDPYDFAVPDDSAPPPVPKASPPQFATAPVPAAHTAVAGAGVSGMGYVATQSRAEKYRRTGPAEDSLVSKPRDVYLPYGLCVAGGLAIFAWAMYALGVRSDGIAMVSVVAGLITLIKTGVILGLALMFAPKLGISFGDFGTAVRKLVAVVVVSDAALLWAGTIMDELGATRPGWISLREVVIRVVLAAAIISALCHFLFDMDAEETGMFAVPLALISLVLGFVLKIAAFVALAALFGGGAEADDAVSGASGEVAAATRPATGSAPTGAAADAQSEPGETPAAAATPGAGAASEATPPTAEAADEGNVGAISGDEAVVRRMRDTRFIRDGMAWATSREGEPERKLVMSFLTKGATKVSFDFKGGKNQRPAKLYIELPSTSPRVRAPLFKLHLDYRRDNQIESDPQIVQDHGQRFLVLELKQ